MNSYDTNVTIVLDKLNEVEYEQRVRDYHCRTYHEFKQFLNEKGVQYSADMANVWLQLSKRTCTPCTYGERSRSIKKLNDVFELGRVRPPHLSSEKVAILPSLEDMLDHFLNKNKNNYTKASCRDYRMHCRQFLRFLQSRKITDLSQLSYAVIDEYFAFFSCDNPGVTMVGMFLRHLADTGVCTAGLFWYFHYYRETWLLCPQDLTPEQHALIDTYRTESGHPLNKYQEISDNYLGELKQIGYQSTVLLHAQRAFRLLLVFLEMSHLEYQKPIADVWYEANEVNLGRAKHMIKRTRCLSRYLNANSIFYLLESS